MVCRYILTYRELLKLFSFHTTSSRLQFKLHGGLKEVVAIRVLIQKLLDKIVNTLTVTI